MRGYASKAKKQVFMHYLPCSYNYITARSRGNLQHFGHVLLNHKRFRLPRRSHAAMKNYKF